MSETSLRIVLDTNVLLVSISSRSPYHWIFEALVDKRFDLLISNEILTEYEEIIGLKFDSETAGNVVRLLLTLPNVQRLQPAFFWKLIEADPDDDKFVDCAVAGNAHAVITEDRHFKVLEGIDFPRVQCLDIHSFKSLLVEDGS